MVILNLPLMRLYCFDLGALIFKLIVYFNSNIQVASALIDSQLQPKRGTAWRIQNSTFLRFRGDFKS